MIGAHSQPFVLLSTLSFPFPLSFLSLLSPSSLSILPLPTSSLPFLSLLPLSPPSIPSLSPLPLPPPSSFLPGPEEAPRRRVISPSSAQRPGCRPHCIPCQSAPQTRPGPACDHTWDRRQRTHTPLTHTADCRQRYSNLQYLSLVVEFCCKIESVLL